MKFVRDWKLLFLNGQPLYEVTEETEDKSGGHLNSINANSLESAEPNVVNPGDILDEADLNDYLVSGTMRRVHVVDCLICELFLLYFCSSFFICVHHVHTHTQSPYFFLFICFLTFSLFCSFASLPTCLHFFSNPVSCKGVDPCRSPL